jgi:heterodisulfide reductase subunit A-like polyferredoxin
MPDQDFDLEFDKVILTSGMQRKVVPIAGNFGNKHMNVVTDLQVERMLAVTGPSDGLSSVLRTEKSPRR